jgi:hypothetical protein
MKEIGSWNRKFQVWQYSVSHSFLLLRSYHAQKYDTRIDMLFSLVSLMKLRPSYEPFAIQEASEEEAIRFLAEQRPSHGSLYLINGGEGYICATKCVWHEDEGNHRTPSHFGPMHGTA